jgi:hypothetical protein
MGAEAPSEPAGETKSFCLCREKAPVGSFFSYIRLSASYIAAQ